MRNVKLSAAQDIRVRDSYAALQKVLNEIKRSTLTGDAIVEMRTLEGAVRHLEAFILQVS